MKKIISMFLSFACITSLAVDSTYATSIDSAVTDNAYAIDENTRAVSKPTSMAPNSWYEVFHQWTAKYYTYSAYKFEGGWNASLTVYCDTPFSVEVYDEDDNLVYDFEAKYWPTEKENYYVIVNPYSDWRADLPDTYWFIIRNEGSSPISTSENAVYFVNK